MLLVASFARCFDGYRDLAQNSTAVNFTAVPAKEADCPFPEKAPLQFSVIAHGTLGSVFLYFKRDFLSVRIPVNSLVPREYDIVAYFGNYSETLCSLDEVERNSKVFLYSALATAGAIVVILGMVLVVRYVRNKRKIIKITTYVEDWIDRSLLGANECEYAVAVDENVTKLCRQPGQMVDMY